MWADQVRGTGYRDGKPSASGVSLAVVLNDHLAEDAWPVSNGAAADLQGRDRWHWVQTRGYRSQSLSSSACLINGRAVTCSCRSRSAVRSRTDSVWLPAAKATVSCWSTSWSTYSGALSSEPSGGRAPSS